MKKRKIIKPYILVLAYILVCAFWFGVHSFDVYEYPVAGAIYEMLSISMLLMLIVIPLAAFYFWYKKNFSLSSSYLYIGVFTPVCTFLLYHYFFR